MEEVDLSASPTRKKQSKMGEKKCRRAEFRDSGGGKEKKYPKTGQGGIVWSFWTG